MDIRHRAAAFVAVALIVVEFVDSEAAVSPAVIVVVVVFASNSGEEQEAEQRIAYWVVFERLMWEVELERVLGIAGRLDIALL